MGIISSEQGESDDAKSYFEKAIEFKPDYTDSYVAIVNILLQEQTVIIGEMDKIAMSNKRSDIAKYDQLKEDLNEVWRKCIPYCEKALEYDPNDLEVLKLLSSTSAQIAQGEVLQLQHKSELDIIEETYLKIITSKTASLFSASSRVGAILGNQEEKLSLIHI